MKVTVMRPVEIEVLTVGMVLPVRYGTEDMPADFPFRVGDTWSVFVDAATGKIHDWPQEYGAFDLQMKVVDEGVYTLFGDCLPDTMTPIEEVAVIEGYVPNGVVPGMWGDYVDLKIAADGTITNWPKEPDFSAFFPSEV
jgi:hypothetical protein